MPRPNPRPAVPPAPESPLFVLAGMPRAGTTYMYHALAAHPAFHLPSRKELRFFSHHYEKGADWYAAQFGSAPAGRIRADLSPDYFMHAGVATRIARHPGEVRVALAVRDPAAWAVSLHRHLRSFERQVPAFPAFLRQCHYPDFRWPGQASRTAALDLTGGFIASRLASFREALGDRLLLYDFAAFEKDPLTVVRSLEKFLRAGPALDPARLPPQRMNSRPAGRRGPLTYWLSRDSVSHLMARLLPRSVLLPLRRRWEADASAAITAEETRDLQLARDALAGDGAFVAELFRETPVRLGSGAPFPG